jgi:acyl-CoA reductase-like NAD-dependent aldehyde dehydrogenase
MQLVSTNPSRNYEAIGEVETSTAEDVARTVAAAHAAQPAWAGQPLAERCARVSSFVEVARRRIEEIALLIAMETGRPITGARDNVQAGIDYFTAYIEMADDCLAPQITRESDGEVHRVHREPWGVVAAICPWNYPFLNLAFQWGQALIAGNTIVHKNSEENPLFTRLLAGLAAESDLPIGVLNVVYGDGRTGDLLARADVDMISFTGSTRTGRAVARVAAEKFIPIVAELGGSTPCVVFDGADPVAVAELAYSRRFVNNGQSCDAVKRLIVHESCFDEVVSNLCDVIATKRVGDAADDRTDIGPLVSERQLATLEGQVGDAHTRGAKVAIGGGRPRELSGAYHLPTALTGVTRDMRVWSEEVFGPVLPVVAFKTDDEAIDLANDTPYGLSAYIVTDDRDRFRRVARRLQSGMIAQNHVTYWHPQNPFGGYKGSGMGRTHGRFGFDEVTQVKLVSEER